MLLVLLAGGTLLRAQTSAARALQQALQGTHAAGVVLDMQTGAVVARVGDAGPMLPGSTVKPMVLAWALRHGVVSAKTEVYCRRNLRIGGRALQCTHPGDVTVLRAETAIAESCNTYFAQLGRRMTGAQMEAALSEAGLPHDAFGDASGDARALTALGLRGVHVTPQQLAVAYRAMLLREGAESPVWRGMVAAVVYGMANPARVQGVELLGKTGTVSEPGQAWTHGWFAGAMPGRLVLVVALPRGDGGDAARLARRFFVGLQR